MGKGTHTHNTALPIEGPFPGGGGERFYEKVSDKFPNGKNRIKNGFIFHTSNAAGTPRFLRSVLYAKAHDHAARDVRFSFSLQTEQITILIQCVINHWSFKHFCLSLSIEVCIKIGTKRAVRRGKFNPFFVLRKEMSEQKEGKHFFVSSKLTATRKVWWQKKKKKHSFHPNG